MPKIEKDFELAVIERSGGVCEWCIAHGLITQGTDAHHIWPKSTARKPSKWDINQLPEGLEDWPHVELNGIYLCNGCHSGAHGTSGKAKKGAGPGIRISRPAFYDLLPRLYPDTVFNGKTYPEWFAGPGPWSCWKEE